MLLYAKEQHLKKISLICLRSLIFKNYVVYSWYHKLVDHPPTILYWVAGWCGR